MEILNGFKKKIKGFFISEDSFYVIIGITLVIGSLASYLIGYEEGRKGALQTASFAASSPLLPDSSVSGDSGEFVALSSGSVFYAVFCKETLKIDEEKKIFFQDEEQALRAGFKKAKRCKL